MITMFWLPNLSDTYGRRWPMIGAIAAQLTAYVIIYFTRNLYLVYFCMIIMGGTFPGKHVVVYNYIIEVS